MGYAEYQPRLTTGVTVQVVKRALKYFSFPVTVIQTDNGHEFGEYLFYELQRVRIRLRHSRVRKPNDNAHVERFIRTIQEECFSRMLPNPDTVVPKLRAYIEYYNTRRIHLGIGCKTPTEMLQRS
jgi:transposase InsO family protein